MKFAVKVAVSSKGNLYRVLGVITDNGHFRSFGFIKPFDVAYLLNLTARDAEELRVGIYKIE